TPISSTSSWPAAETFPLFFDSKQSDGLAFITRSSKPVYHNDYNDLYAGDTIVAGNWTFQAGARYDRQRGKNDASSVAANPDFPEILPAATYAGDARVLQWTSLSPRLGVTYSPKTTRKTVFRAAYNRYADQLGATAIAA